MAIERYVKQMMQPCIELLNPVYVNFMPAVLSATRELLHAFRAHHWLHSVGVTKWLILILLRWWTRQTVLDVKVWWPQYTIDNYLILRLPDSMLKPVQLVVAQAFFCLKKGVWRRCMACISFVSTAFSNVFSLEFAAIRGHFVTVQLLKKYGKTCLTPAPLYLLDPFGTPTWTWESSIVRRERHPCNEKGEASM